MTAAALPSYIDQSLPSSVRPITLAILAEAKRLLATGLGLHATAKALGVLSSDLDASLWGHIGEDHAGIGKPVRRLPEADF